MSEQETGGKAADDKTLDGAADETGAGSRKNVLGHLLKIEAEAASLVDDAQAEADRRIAEAEKQNRARYDQAYTKQAAELETAFEGEVARIRGDYQDRLDQYRKSLDAIPVDQGLFSARMDELLTATLPSREL
jgi:vacuolar-type H+-ATPase subunit H